MKPLDLQVNMNSLLRYSQDQGVENIRGVVHQMEIDEKAILDARKANEKINENEESEKSLWDKDHSDNMHKKNKNNSHGHSSSSGDVDKETGDSNGKTGHRDFFA